MENHTLKEHSSTVKPEWQWRVELRRTDGATEGCNFEDISGWFKNNEGGPYVKRFEKEFASFLGATYALTTSSGSAAIYVALKACGINNENDFVAVPTYTHIGSVAPIILAGGTPVFIDSDKYGNISVEDLGRYSRNFFKAIITVHQLGIPCDIDEIKNKHDALIIEDASHALGSLYKGTPCGLLGDIGCFSIGGGRTKTIGTGEGGMIVTNNSSLAEKCKNIRNHGDRNFDVDYFCFNFRMSDLNAAVGLMQMDKLDYLLQWQIHRALYIRYNLPSYLEPTPIPDYASTCHYIIGCHFNREKAGMTREQFLEKMKPFQVGPRKYVGPGYSKLISDVKFYSRFTHMNFPIAEKLRDESVWIDYHRFPRTKEEIDMLLKVLKELEHDGNRKIR
jgi:perosamine synthetase